MKTGVKFLNSISRTILFLLVGAYRTIGSNHLGGGCRFEPSCSEYALDAIRLHPPHKAVRLIAGRISRCRPGGDFGFDPVPRAEFKELKT